MTQVAYGVAISRNRIVAATGLAAGLTVAAPTGLGPATIRATDVPPNVYSLVTVCPSDRTSEIAPFIMVGDPIAAIGGSIATFGGATSS